MKLLSPVIFALVTLIMISCKNNNPSSVVKKNEKVDATISENIKVGDSLTENKIDTNNCRFVISFYSIGQGSEYLLINAFEDSIGSYSLKFGKNIDYKKTSWGREGEIDFCLKLNELSQEDQKEFISLTRSQLKVAKWVNVFENYPCPARMRR